MTKKEMTIFGASRPEALLLLGPTASGKSALALALAEHFEIESFPSTLRSFIEAWI